MINSKNALMKALREDKSKIKFKTIRNSNWPLRVGVVRNAGTKLQTNCFTIETEKEDGKIVDSHVWLNEIDVKNNVITFKEKYGDIQIEIIEVA